MIDLVNKYNVIYADPPWEIKAGRTLGKYTLEEGVQKFNVKDNMARNLEYPTLTIQQIKDLRVKEIAAKDAHLYMWVTNHHLQYAFDIIKKWGFNYSTTLVWAKNSIGGGLGGTFKINTEFLLFARRGKLTATQTNFSTWYQVKRNYENGVPKHSKKPYFFHQLIEQTSPGKRIELFAREKRGSWDVWGNETNSDLRLENRTI
jgi:N6-adenosine-specific RNA methylase IME4